MVGRKLWEASFQKKFLTKVFSEADQVVNEARKTILEFKQKTDLDK